MPGGQQGRLLLFPRVPVQPVAVHQHNRRTGPVILVVDPDSGAILPPDSDIGHRDPHRFACAVVTPASVSLSAPDRQERYPQRYCTSRAPGMPGPWSRLTQGTASTKRTGREDRHMPGPGEPPARPNAPIIGRDAALARLRALVDPVPQSSRVLLITGE